MLQDVDILVSVETWLSPNNKFGNFPGFLTFRQDRSHSRGGGILMIIRKNIAFCKINNLLSPNDSVELLGVQLTQLNPPLNLLACYRTPGQSLTQDQWDLIFKNIVPNSNCIFMGDFNSHNKIWNCRFTDTNGVRLNNSAEAFDLFLHNESSLTHIDLYRDNRSNLDLIFSTIDISDKIHVEVCDETLGSDHFPLIITYDTLKHLYKKQSFKIQSIRTDWDKFETVLESKFSVSYGRL